jgi:putative transcriptional regulator
LTSKLGKCILIMTRILVISKGVHMPLKNKVKDYRTAAGINQQEFGRLVGVSRQTISSIECGDYHPSVLVALKIAKILNTTVEDVFEFVEDGNE